MLSRRICQMFHFLKSKNRAKQAFAIMLLLLGSASAEVVTVKKVVKYKKEASIDFSGSIIKSKIRTPEVFYVFRRKRTHGGELNILPMNFNYHLAETRSITQTQLKK